MLALMLAVVLSPEALHTLDELARKAAGEGCPSGAQLEQTVQFAPDRTVLVYSLATHPFPENGCSPEYRCAWVAVLIDHGIAKFSSVGNGEPQELGIGPDGSAWLYTLWTIEAGDPHLWRSVDAREWRDISLPRMRTTTGVYSEVIERIGVRNREIRIERSGMGEKDVIECWRITPRVAFIHKGRCAALEPLRRTTKHR